MADNVLAGSGSYIYWVRNATFKSGGGTDTHQAFNPMVKSMDFPDSIRYALEEVSMFNDMYHSLRFDSKLEEGTVRFSCRLRDPFILATAFTYKGLPTSWSESDDVMTFNFSTLSNQDKNIGVFLHIHDQSGNSNHMDIFLDGGELVSYKLLIAEGAAIIEEFEIQFAEINIGTETTSVAYAPDIADGFDDASFDQTGVAEVSTVIAIAKASLDDGEYFKLWKANGTGGFTAYYAYMDVAGDASGDPAPSGFTAIRCNISASGTAQSVSDVIQSAIDGVTGFTATNASGTSTTVTVTNDETGDLKDMVDVDTTMVIAVTTQGVTAVDGGWSMWDAAYTSKTCALSVDATISFGTAGLNDIHITNASIELSLPKESIRVQNSLTVSERYLKARDPYVGVVSGILKQGNDNVVEPSTVIGSKTAATFKIQYGTTKILEFTLGIIVTVSGGGVEAGQAQEIEFRIKGDANSVATFSWTASEADDPSDMINHTDVA